MKTLKNFLETIFANENALSFWERGEIHTCSGSSMLEKISFARSFLDKIKPGSTVLISMRQGMEPVFWWIACLCQNLKPAFIAHPSKKISLSEFEKKLDILVKLHKPACIILDTDTHLPIHLPSLSHPLDQSLPFNWENIPLDPQFSQFSSGSTGTPKGISYQFSQLLDHTETLHTAIFASFEEKMVSWLPLYHDMGLIGCLLFPLSKKIPLCLISPFDWVENPSLFFDLVQSFQASLSWMPNFAFRLLVEKCSHWQGNLTSIRMLANCAEPVEVKTMQDFYQTFQKNGLSETSLAITWAMAENIFAMTHKQINMTKEDWFLSLCEKDYRHGKITITTTKNKETSVKIASCGTPLKNLEISCETNERISCLKIRGPHTVSSYLPDTPILENGWFNTKDLGFIHQNEVFVTGRESDLIIHRGVNLYPQEIESFLNEHFPLLYPGRNVVVGISDPATGTEEIFLFCETLHQESILQRHEIRNAIRNKFSILPKQVVFLPHMWLLKTSSGKISRKLNKEKYLALLEKKIYVAGCSHIYAFNHNNDLYNEETCAKNIHLRQIPVGSSENILREPRFCDFMNWIDTLENNALLVFHFGEQDVRNLIPFRMKTLGLSMEEACKKSITEWNLMIEKIKRKRKDLEMIWFLSPPPGEGLPPHPRFLKSQNLSDDLYYHYQADLTTRRKVADLYKNILLENLILPIINPWPFIADKNLNIHPCYIRDKSHVKDTASLYEDLLCLYSNRPSNLPRTPSWEKETIQLDKNNAEETISRFLYESFGLKPKLEDDILSMMDSLQIVDLFMKATKRFHLHLPENFTNRKEIKNFKSLIALFLLCSQPR